MPSHRNAYDHRLRELVSRTRDLDLAERLGVPLSTAKSWLRRRPASVVTADLFDADADHLRDRVLRLERRVGTLLAIVRLLFLLVRMAGLRLDAKRLPNGAKKHQLLEAIARSSRVVPRAVALRVVGLRPARYHAWRQKAPCHLDDRSSCPKTRPTQLAPSEVRVMRDMVTSLDFRHFSIRALALHAQRIGRVFAAPGTWSKHIRENGWLRPRRRLHPPKPKEGIRTSCPNELWHLDVSLIRLLDGTKLFLHAVIDNYSRKLLAWELATKLDPTTTCQVLGAAAHHLPGGVPTVACDSGVENVNRKVDALIECGQLHRVLAQVEVSYSNSMIEAWWRNLKHSWLYLHTLDSAAAVKKLVAFYVEQHNTVMPHREFNGRTPDEVYFGTATDLEDDLSARRRQARTERVATNRALTCATCEPRGTPAEAVARDAA